VFSVSLTSGKDTYVELFANDSDCFNDFVFDHWVADSITAQAFIGLNSASTEPWNGFIYEFHVSQFIHTLDKVTLQAGGCNSGNCWSVPFNQYINSEGETATCDPTCADIGCCREGECQSTCFKEFCHLCPDYECRACEVYGICLIESCGTNAVNSGTVCKCEPEYGRVDEGDPCDLCHGDCLTCDTPA
jgi:hypothetical protein